MSKWKDFLKHFDSKEIKVETLKQKLKGIFRVRVYPRSINEVGNAIVMMARGDEEKCLLVIGEDSRLEDLEGTIIEQDGIKIKVCPLSNENCDVIRAIFHIPILKAIRVKITMVLEIAWFSFSWAY